MEVNDFMDLNTTELFDDSNDSFDENEEMNNSDTVMIVGDDDNNKKKFPSGNESNSILMDGTITTDAGTTSTDLIIGTQPTSTIEDIKLLNSISVPTAVITPAIPSGLSIVQKCTKSQLPSDIIAIKKPIVSENLPIQINIRPTTVMPKTLHDVNINLENPANVSSINEQSFVSIRPQLSHQKIPTIKGQLNSIGKYTKLHTALVSTMAETIHPPTKLVKIAPSNTSLSTTNAIADIKTSPVIIVQTPAQKLGQKFTSLKILQKCPTPGSIVKQKILNLNEMRKLNSTGSLKLLNASATNSTISSSETNFSYLPAQPSLIVLKPPTTMSTTASVTQPSTTLQLKPQQLYQSIVPSNPTKPTTISFVTAPTPKATSISIGSKLIPSRILTAIKPATDSASTVGSVIQHPLPVGLTKIPKDTIVNKIPTKDAQGIDFMRMMKAKQSEKPIEPTVTIGQKQMCNKPPLEFQSLTNFLSSNDKPKGLFSTTTKSTDHSTIHPIHHPNAVLVNGNEKIEEAAPIKDVESITISNGKLSNPNGSIKLLKSVTETDVDVDMAVLDVPQTVVAIEDDNCDEKTVAKLNTSPRLLGRSKSLTIAKEQSKVRRRYPSSGYPIPMIPSVEKSKQNVNTQQDEDDDAVKLDNQMLIDEEPEPTEVEIIEESIETEPTKNVGDSLECDEKIDDSDKSKSVSPDVGHGGNVRPNPAPVPNSATVNLTSSFADANNDDPLTYIKWRNGIGFLKYSNLQFRKNEFNLLEILELKEFVKNQNNVKTSIKGNANEPTEIIDLVERKADVSDKSAIVKKKLESKQRFKRAGMNLLQNVFVWELYLRLMDAQAAPDSLFINPFPSSQNTFEVGMKMEAIDPEHCSLFCVCTVVEKLGYRIRLSFDGYSDKFSFWRNADSMDIFPPGWCAKTGRVLQPPLKYGSEPFDWHRYILKTNGKFAPRSNFTHLNSMTSRNPFKVGMKLEADHLKLGRGKVGIATIGDVLDNRILIQFDGFDSSHDYWADITSPNIHPYNWHKANKCRLIVVKEFEKNFSWPLYLSATMSQPVPKDFFCPRPPIGFREGMKLEIVDKKVPTLIRPCTVIQVADYNIQVLFDGWPSTYLYWIEDDHPDIHPINWCLKTEHPLEPPLNFGQEEFRSACGVLGCREVGNAKHFGVGFHYTIFECPYESRNWLSNDIKPDRLYEIKTQKVRSKRKAKPIMSASESYQKIKLELPPEENSLQNPPSNEWNVTPSTIKNEEIEIGETKLQQTTIAPITPESSPTRLPKHIKVTEPILRDYGPGLMNIHKLWIKNSKSMNIRRIATNPICWTVDDVVDYVSRLPNCSKLGKIFRDHEIDGDSFLKLCQNDLIDVLELRMGPAVKIYNQIVALRSDVCENFME